LGKAAQAANIGKEWSENFAKEAATRTKKALQDKKAILDKLKALKNIAEKLRPLAMEQIEAAADAAADALEIASTAHQTVGQWAIKAGDFIKKGLEQIPGMKLLVCLAKNAIDAVKNLGDLHLSGLKCASELLVKTATSGGILELGYPESPCATWGKMFGFGPGGMDLTLTQSYGPDPNPVKISTTAEFKGGLKVVAPLIPIEGKLPTIQWVEDSELKTGVKVKMEITIDPRAVIGEISSSCGKEGKDKCFKFRYQVPTQSVMGFQKNNCKTVLGCGKKATHIKNANATWRYPHLQVVKILNGKFPMLIQAFGGIEIDLEVNGELDISMRESAAPITATVNFFLNTNKLKFTVGTDPEISLAVQETSMTVNAEAKIIGTITSTATIKPQLLIGVNGIETVVAAKQVATATLAADLTAQASLSASKDDSGTTGQSTVSAFLCFAVDAKLEFEVPRMEKLKLTLKSPDISLLVAAAADFMFSLPGMKASFTLLAANTACYQDAGLSVPGMETVFNNNLLILAEKFSQFFKFPHLSETEISIILAPMKPVGPSKWQLEEPLCLTASDNSFFGVSNVQIKSAHAATAAVHAATPAVRAAYLADTACSRGYGCASGEPTPAKNKHEYSREEERARERAVAGGASAAYTFGNRGSVCVTQSGADAAYTDLGMGKTLAQCIQLVTAGGYSHVNFWSSDGRCRGLHSCPKEQLSPPGYDEYCRVYTIGGQSRRRTFYNARRRRRTVYDRRRRTSYAPAVAGGASAAYTFGNRGSVCVTQSGADAAYKEFGRGKTLAQCIQLVTAGGYSHVNYWSYDGRCRGLHSCPKEQLSQTGYDEYCRVYTIAHQGDVCIDNSAPYQVSGWRSRSTPLPNCGENCARDCSRHCKASGYPFFGSDCAGQASDTGIYCQCFSAIANRRFRPMSECQTRTTECPGIVSNGQRTSVQFRGGKQYSLGAAWRQSAYRTDTTIPFKAVYHRRRRTVYHRRRRTVYDRRRRRTFYNAVRPPAGAAYTFGNRGAQCVTQSGAGVSYGELGMGKTLAQCITLVTAGGYSHVNFWSSDGRCRGLHSCPKELLSPTGYDGYCRVYTIGK